MGGNPIKSIVGGILGGSLFGSSMKPKPPPLMPDPNDPQMLLQQKLKIARAAESAGGRASTNLAPPTDYTRSTF